MWLKSPFLSGKPILFFPSPAAIKEFASWKLGLLVALVNARSQKKEIRSPSFLHWVRATKSWDFFSVLDLAMPFFGSKGMLKIKRSLYLFKSSSLFELRHK